MTVSYSKETSIGLAGSIGALASSLPSLTNVLGIRAALSHIESQKLEPSKGSFVGNELAQGKDS